LKISAEASGAAHNAGTSTHKDFDTSERTDDAIGVVARCSRPRLWRSGCIIMRFLLQTLFNWGGVSSLRMAGCNVAVILVLIRSHAKNELGA
jgi:hypothetical protein